MSQVPINSELTSWHLGIATERTSLGTAAGLEHAESRSFPFPARPNMLPGFRYRPCLLLYRAKIPKAMWVYLSQHPKSYCFCWLYFEATKTWYSPTHTRVHWNEVLIALRFSPIRRLFNGSVPTVLYVRLKTSWWTLTSAKLQLNRVHKWLPSKLTPISKQHVQHETEIIHSSSRPKETRQIL